MDKHLRPSRFETEPNASNAEKAWKHWYRTFTNFLKSLTTTQQTATTEGGDAGDNAGQVEAQNQANKLELLTNYISENVFDYIMEAETFDAAVAILENLYVKAIGGGPAQNF